MAKKLHTMEAQLSAAATRLHRRLGAKSQSSATDSQEGTVPPGVRGH